LGGGLPISATIYRDDIAKEITPNLWAGMTHSGSPLMCAAASVTLDIIVEEKAAEKSAKMGDYLTQRLKKMGEEYDLIGNVRGPGLFIGIELVKNRKTKEPAVEETLKTAQMCLEKGVWLGTSQQPGIGNVIKLKPPFIINKHETSKVLDVLRAVFKKK
jgi:4-aminobutyrate aminotransferase-like enzyme